MRDPWDPDYVSDVNNKCVYVESSPRNYELAPAAARRSVENARPDRRPVEIELLGSGRDF